MIWVIRAAVNLSAQIANTVQAGNRFTILLHGLTVFIDLNAGTDGRDSHMTANCPEWAILDRMQVGRILSEILIHSLLTEFVIAINSLFQNRRINVDLFGQLFDGIRSVRIQQVCDLAGCIFRETGDITGHDLRRHRRSPSPRPDDPRPCSVP